MHLTEPAWLFLALPLLLLIYFRFRQREEALKSPWGFLLQKSASRSQEKEVKSLLWIPALLCLVAFSLLILILSELKSKPRLHVLFQRPDILKSQAASMKGLIGKLKDHTDKHRLSELCLYLDEKQVVVQRDDLDQLFEKIQGGNTRSQVNFSKLPGRKLVVGIYPQRYPHLDFIPYPLAKDSWWISAIRRLSRDEYWIDVQIDKAPSKPLKLYADGRLAKTLTRTSSGHESFRLNLKGVTAISLRPLDQQAWANHVQLPRTTDKTLDWQSEVKLSPLIEKSLAKIQVGEGSSTKLLLTNSAKNFQQWQGAAILILANATWRDEINIHKSPSDSAHRLVSGKALPQSSRHAMFDLPLKQMPENFFSIRSHGSGISPLFYNEGRPVALKEGMRKVAMTFSPDQIDFRTPQELEAFFRLLISACGYTLLSEPLLIHEYPNTNQLVKRLNSSEATENQPGPIPVDMALLASLLVFSLVIGVDSRHKFVK